MASSDEIEEQCNTLASNDDEITEEQQRKLESIWPIFVRHNTAKIKWISTTMRISVQKIEDWDQKRRANDRNCDTSQQPTKTGRTGFQAKKNKRQPTVRPKRTTVAESNTQSASTAAQQGSEIDLNLGITTNSDIFTSDSSDNNSLGDTDHPGISNSLNDASSESDDNDPSDGGGSNESDNREDEDEIDLSRLHKIFPSNKSLYSLDEYANVTRWKISSKYKENIHKQNLILFVNSSINGNTAKERLRSLIETTTPTIIPVFVGSFSNRKHPDKFFSWALGSKMWKYLKLYDAYRLRIYNPAEFHTTAEFRRQLLFTKIKLALGRVRQLQRLPQYYSEFLNAARFECYYEKSLDHLQSDEASDFTRRVIDEGVSLICDHLTMEECGNPDCQHVIHFDQLELIRQTPQTVINNDDRNGIPINLFRNQSFNFGKGFTPKNVEIDNQRNQYDIPEPEENAIEQIKLKLDGYRLVQSDFFVYVAIGISAANPKDQAPRYLDLNMIHCLTDAYLVAGRSKYAGLPPHHLDARPDSGSLLGQIMHRKKLNVFWMLRNIHCTTFKEAELYEAVYQVLCLHIQTFRKCNRLKKGNKKLEYNALDFLTHNQMKEFVTVLTQPGVQFLYDTEESIPENLSFGFIQKPLILSGARRLNNF